MSKPLDAWGRINDAMGLDTELAKKGYAIISMSDQKKHSGNFEPRILNKQDHRRQIPEFCGGIMSISNKTVMIIDRDLFIDFPTEGRQISNWHISREVDDIADPFNVSSEADAQNVVEEFKIMDHFLEMRSQSRTAGKKRLKTHTVTCRVGDGTEFELTLDRPQFETDGVLRTGTGDKFLEVKQGNHDALHIRQMYYPMLWLKQQGKTPEGIILRWKHGGKKTTPLAHLDWVTIGDPDDMFSIRIKKSATYKIIDNRPIAHSDGVLLDVPYPNYDAPPPQADNLGLITYTARVILNLVDENEREELTGMDAKEYWISKIGYDKRQWDYYRNAAIWFRLIESDDTAGELAETLVIEEGTRHADQRKALRKLKAVALKDPVFKSIQDSIDHNHPLEELKTRAVDVIQANPDKWVNTKNRGTPLGDVTAGRRAQSAHSLLKRLTPPLDRPFLKWAGGKRKVVPYISAAMLADSRRWSLQNQEMYLEPFVGSGSTYFALRGNHTIPSATKAILSDMNEVLIKTMGIVISDNHKELNRRLAVLLEEYKKEIAEHDFAEIRGSLENRMYYKKRAEMNNLIRRRREGETVDEIESAALMIFLNKTCFNGLWRVNSDGMLNVPEGRYYNPENISNPELINRCHELLQSSEIAIRSFETSIKKAKSGDLIYADPPYLPLRKDGYVFTSYSTDGFDVEDHQRLARLCCQAVARGSRVIASNNDTEEVRKIWTEAASVAGIPAPVFREVPITHTMSSKGEGRVKIQEVLILLHPDDE